MFTIEDLKNLIQFINRAQYGNLSSAEVGLALRAKCIAEIARQSAKPADDVHVGGST